MPELTLARLALAFYAAATSLAFVYLFAKDRRWSGWMLRLLGVGAALHLASFVLRVSVFWRIPENRFFVPINTFYGALSYLALAVALVFFIVERRHRLGILGAFVLPWTVLSLGAAVLSTESETAGLTPALRSYWINIHPMILMTAYAAFGNAFGVGLALLVQERQIKSRKPSELCFRLPSIAELDALNYRIILFALPVLAVGIGMGCVWAYHAWGRFWGWDPKETWALITALVYAGFIYMHAMSGLRGRKAVYVSMAGFAFIMFTFVGVNYLSELHGYLSGD